MSINLPGVCVIACSVRRFAMFWVEHVQTPLLNRWSGHSFYYLLMAGISGNFTKKYDVAYFMGSSMDTATSSQGTDILIPFQKSEYLTGFFGIL